ncbi:MAG: MFS transporter, partial [Chloroflexi bacterium]|nr:MFS transporter [Chloroflexota bacterium]
IFYGWWIALAAFIGVFVSSGSFAYVSGAFLEPMREELGWTSAEYLYGQTASQFVMGFAGFFLGVHIDRRGSRPLMLIGAVVLGVSLVLIGFVEELWQWVLLKGVAATVGGALVGNLVVNVTLAKWFVEQRGRAVGWASIGVSMSGVVLPPLMTWYIDEWGWRAAWQALGIGSTLLILPAALLMRRQPEDYGLHPDGKTDAEMASGGGAAAIADYANSLTRAEALRTSVLYLLVVAFGLGSLGLITVIVILIPYLTDSGFERNTAALMLTLFAVAAAVSKPLWGWMGDNWSDRASTALSFLMNAAGMLVLVAGVAGDSSLIVGIGAFVVGWGVGGQIPLQEMIWASYFGRRYLGEVRAVTMPFAMLMAASGPLLVAAYFDWTGEYAPAMLAIAAGWALAAAIVLFVRRPAAPVRGVTGSAPR